MDSLFTDPYADLSREALDTSGESVVYRLNSEVSRADLNFIRSLRPKVNTITIVTNILIKKLVDALKERGIDCYADRERFERFVGGCTIVGPTEVALNDPTDERHPRRGEASPPYVGRGASPEGADAPGEPSLPADVRSNATTRGGGSKRAKGRKEA